jgi:hypothetical protein
VWLAAAASAALVGSVVVLSAGGDDADVAAAPSAADRARPGAPAKASASPIPDAAPRARAAAGVRAPEREGGDGEAVAARDEAPAPEPAQEDRRSSSLVGLEREAARLVEASDFAGEVDARVAALEPIPGEPADAFDRRREAFRERLGSESFLLARRLRDLYAGVVYPLGFPVEMVVAQERGWIEALPPEDREVMLRLALEEREERAPERTEPRFEGFETAGDDAAPDL